MLSMEMMVDGTNAGSFDGRMRVGSILAGET